MRRPLVAGNWKLNGSRAANASLIAGIRRALPASRTCDVMVCPPYVFLAEVVEALEGSGILVGAQDASVEAQGAFTGEVSTPMLRDVGCTHVIVGHSERRALFGETDEVVAQKFTAVRSGGAVPILCVGETLEERESGKTTDVVGRQIAAVLDAVPLDRFAGSIVAYEPVWAIGTGRTASPGQAQEVHALLRSIVAARDARIGAELRILYGGSVKGSNAQSLFAMPDIDGGLVGGASLDAADFVAICSAASGTVG